MNRLVLVGNGYDLAARLNTSYEHFLVDYFKQAMLSCLTSERNDYEDEIMFMQLSKLEKEVYDKNKQLLEVPINKEQVKKIINKIKKIDDILLEDRKFYFKTHNVDPSSDTLFEIDINSNFLKDLLGDYNWRDIESYYFNRLLNIYKIELNEYKRDFYKGDELEEYIKVKRKDYLFPLNNQFEHLRAKIIEYLSKINTDRARSFKFIEQLKTPMDEELFKKLFNKGDFGITTNNQIENVRFINFNYTLALENAITNRGQNKLYSRKDILYIHGDIYDKEKIIFGYGDDTDPVFKELEKTGEDKYLKHLKSFQYPLSKSYLELMDYIHYDQFEVIIAGHSLGISDRVLLKTIFEHDNCKAIRILHRGRIDEEKRIQNRYMALARHFDNKMIMRNKIVPFEMSDKLH